MFGALRFQHEEAMQRSVVILRKVGGELTEYRGRHAFRPVGAGHETRACVHQNQAAEVLRKMQCTMQCEQTAERPAEHIDRAIQCRQQMLPEGRKFQRQAAVALAAVSGKIDATDIEVRLQVRQQGCEDAAVHGPAVQQNQIRPMHGRLR